MSKPVPKNSIIPNPEEFFNGDSALFPNKGKRQNTNEIAKKRTAVPDASTVLPEQHNHADEDEHNDIVRSNTDTSTDIATFLTQGTQLRTTKRVRVRHPFEYYEDDLQEFLNLKDMIRKKTGQDVSYSRMAREAMTDYTTKIKNILENV